MRDLAAAQAWWLIEIETIQARAFVLELSTNPVIVGLVALVGGLLAERIRSRVKYAEEEGRLARETEGVKVEGRLTLAALNASVAKELREGMQSQMDRLLATQETQESRIEESSARMYEWQGRYHALNAEHAMLVSQHHRLQTEHTELRAEYASLRAEVELLRRRPGAAAGTWMIGDPTGAG